MSYGFIVYRRRPSIKSVTPITKKERKPAKAKIILGSVPAQNASRIKKAPARKYTSLDRVKGSFLFDGT